MNRLPSAPIATALLLGLLAFAGCMAPQTSNTNNGGTGSAGSQNTGTASFFVKDAPADDFDAVYITFHHVEVHKTGPGDANETNQTEDMNETYSTSPAATNATTPTTAAAANETNSSSPAATTSSSMMTTNDSENESDMGGSGWLTIVNSDHTVDLKQFQGDASAFLGEENITAGTYTQIRIHVTAAWGMQNGTRVNITIPSGDLKVVRPWTIVAGKETALTVDFDLSKSLQKTGSGEYKLKPTLKLSVQNDAHTQGGRTAAPTGTVAATTAHSGGRPTNTTRSHGPG